MNLAKLAIKRPTFVMVILVVTLILGVLSLDKLSVRMFPDIELPYVVVRTSYRGAGVTEIEQLVTKPIEDAVSGISGLKHVKSINQDGLSTVWGEFELSKNPDIAAQEIRDKMGQIRPLLPDDIEEPVIMKIDVNSRPIVSLSIKAENMKHRELYDFVENTVSKDFAQVSGVSNIEIIGDTKREIHINVDKEKLKEHELSLVSLAEKIKLSASDTPSGVVTRGFTDIAFKTVGEFKSVQQINDVVIKFVGNDRPITIRDVAEVEDGIKLETSRARLDVRKNDKVVYDPALLLKIYRQAKGNDVAVSCGIKKKIAEVNEKYKQLNGKPHLTIISDTARVVKANIDDVKSTILEGIFLAIVVVYFFLGSWRSTFITALSLPNSLIGSFVFMYVFGFSLNVFSLMSLSLAVGLLIDDAIVVRENIFRHYEKGLSPLKSAIDGTNEVTSAVIATTVAVIVVFLPVAFLRGILGRMFKEFGLTVVFAMVISIFDALTIAPMLSAYIIPEHSKKISKKWAILETIIRIFRMLTVNWFDKAFSFIERIYEKMISFVLRGKKFGISLKFITLFITFFIAVGTGMVAIRYLKTTFMPASESGEFNIKVKFDPGTSLDQMDKYTKLVEEVVMSDLNVEFASSSVGGSGINSSSNESVIYVKLIPFRGLHGSASHLKRTRSSLEMKDHFRKILNDQFGDKLDFSIDNNGIGGSESEFVMELSGEGLEVLHDVANQLMEECKTIPNFVDVHSNYNPGKPEIHVQMDPQKMKMLGVNSVVAGKEIKAMINGVEAGKYRENGLEYDILVKLQDNQKDVAKDFDTIYVKNVNEKLVKLKNVASAKNILSPTEIFRKDRSCYVTVEGNVSKEGTVEEIRKRAVKIFEEKKSNHRNLVKWKNIKYAFSGHAEDMVDMQKDMGIAGCFSVLLIFMVLASLYESIVTPLTIMTALPLAIVGGLIALLISNQPIDMFTLIGMIMLLGIVAKNSILLVDYIQQQIRVGLSMDDSVIKACTVRLRPILMTSFALVAGMLPTALGLSEVGQFRKGMGIVVIGGVISSTVLTLIVVPSIFEYMDKFRCFLRRIMGRPEKRMMDYTEEQLKNKDL
ncbi:MAG: efflux RND transporter permease subunit [Endomicrobium sp.]|jgi:hydrophobe/amphiphile efflux-1 (HAE1) family protein|nr:efflux RND transporter permease subunit [Endomicrobium sp.]